MRILTCYNNIIHPGIAKLVSRLVWYSDQNVLMKDAAQKTPHESAVFSHITHHF